MTRDNRPVDWTKKVCVFPSEPRKNKQFLLVIRLVVLRLTAFFKRLCCVRLFLARGSPEVSKTSLEVPRTSPELPPSLARGQPLSLGSLTPSDDSQKVPLMYSLVVAIVLNTMISSVTTLLWRLTADKPAGQRCRT